MDKPTLSERYTGLLGGLHSAQETLTTITKMAKELVEVGEKHRDKMLTRIQDFLEENYMDMVTNFLGDARAVLMVNSKNNDPDAFEDIKTYGFGFAPAKISDDKTEQMYVHGKFAQVKLKSTESLCVYSDKWPVFEKRRNFIGNHFFDPDIAQSKDARVKYVPIKDFDTVKKYLDASHQIYMAKLRKQVKAYSKETYEQNGTSATTIEYFLDDKPDMLFIYRVASYGIREGYPYEIRCDKKTGYTESESKDSAWWVDGLTVITLDEVKKKLDEYIDLVEKKYAEILSQVEEWFNNLKAN
jgi:hypothetical protein